MLPLLLLPWWLCFRRSVLQRRKYLLPAHVAHSGSVLHHCRAEPLVFLTKKLTRTNKLFFETIFTGLIIIYGWIVNFYPNFYLLLMFILVKFYKFVNRHNTWLGHWHQSLPASTTCLFFAYPYSPATTTRGYGMLVSKSKWILKLKITRKNLKTLGKKLQRKPYKPEYRYETGHAPKCSTTFYACFGRHIWLRE